MKSLTRASSYLLLSFLCGGFLVAGELEVFPKTEHLDFSSSSESRQLVVSQDGRDVSSEVQYKVEPEGIFSIDSTGLMKPTKNGRANLFVIDPKTQKAHDIPVIVKGMDQDQPVHFKYELVPVFTKYGCNGGGCHGKSGGQNGFRLSLLGYEPWNDYDYVVNEARGRRLSPGAPENSLVLMKASGDLPHEGGARLERGSDDYNLVANWIRQGMPQTTEDKAVIERIEVFPKERVAQPGSKQQLAVIAHYDDGRKKDITRLAIFESNQEEMTEVSETGLVTVKDKTGTASVMVRFRELVAVYRATVPLGVKMPALPAPKNFIDEGLFTKLKLLGLPPSKACDDPTFLRRVTLDIAGRLPTAAETDTFLVDKGADKRDRKIDALLNSREYADFFAQKWTGILRNKRAKAEYVRGTFAFHDWIKESLVENKPYNEFVTELLTATGEIGRNPATAWYRSVKDQKEQMQDIAQVFMGIRMQCAQCHHHPYEKWSQDDYYSFTAFFSSIGRKAGEQPGEEVIFHKRVKPAMVNPNTKVSLKPAALGGEPLDIAISVDPRSELAGWMTSPDNPYFAKMLVNRYWKHFFNRGLVEPEDDMRVTNPASHPELLNQLAEHFVADKYDLKKLIHTICSSVAYQLDAEPNAHNLADSQNYSRFYPKRLPAEVLLDSINQIVKSKESFTAQPAGVRAVQLPDDKFNSQSFFLSVFGRPENSSACECERVSDANLAQSLHLINSEAMQKKISSDTGKAADLAKAIKTPDAERVTKLYREALSRNPKATEIEVAVAHLKKKRDRATEKADDKITPESAEKEAFEDILWALLNTKEFLFNH